jgi:hypothetical protein
VVYVHAVEHKRLTTRPVEPTTAVEVMAEML